MTTYSGSSLRPTVGRFLALRKTSLGAPQTAPFHPVDRPYKFVGEESFLRQRVFAFRRSLPLRVGHLGVGEGVRLRHYL